MSEYAYVEKPFLDQLATLGWQVIDQGAIFPTNPARCLRTRFRDIFLRNIFFQSVWAINLTEDGRPWLTDKQLEELFDQIRYPSGTSLLEVNQNVQKLLYRTQVDENELTGEDYPNVKLIDFHHPERNHFLAINQFRIDTPGCVKDCIIPDIVLFVNGMPLGVVECKDANQVQANPMYEAFRQLMRYTDQREATHEAGLREGEPRLFHTNQFVIRTCGEQAGFGTITSTEEEYFYPWRDIYLEKYRSYEPPLGMLGYGVVPILERVDLLGVALFLSIMPPSDAPGGTVVSSPRRVQTALLGLKTSVGLALIVLAFTEKLARPSLALAFLDRFPAFNILRTVGLDVSDLAFIRIAGAVELAFGLLILSGAMPQVVVIAAGIPFNATLFFLGASELIGHLPIYGAMLALFVYGSNRETAPLVPRLQPTIVSTTNSAKAGASTERTTSDGTPAIGSTNVRTVPR